MNENGPKFGDSRILYSGQVKQGEGVRKSTTLNLSRGYGSRSNFSGARSNQSIGGGLASRFSLALSKIMDKFEGQDAGNDDEDIGEIIQLVDELNGHSDLTIKLNNQSKICNIFSKSGKTAQAKKKIETKELDPEILQILEANRKELERLQEEKESAIEEFLDEHTTERMMNQKKIEKEYKKKLAEFEKEQNENDDGEDKTEMIEKFKNENAAELKGAIELFKSQQSDIKVAGLNEIKNKFNILSQQVKLDSKQFLRLIQKKSELDKEAKDKLIEI